MNNIKNNNVLFFCPLPPPITGQAVMSDVLYKSIKPKYVINTNLRYKILGTICVIIQTLLKLIFYNEINTVYLTCTRSKLGAIKDIWLLALCKLRNVRVINHVHGNDIKNLFIPSNIFSRIIIWAYKKINVTIFITNFQKKLLPDHFPNMKKIVIPNFYETLLDNAPKNRISFNHDRNINLLYLSNIMKSKGILILLSVMKDIFQKYPMVNLHIAGVPFKDYLCGKEKIKKEFFKELNFLNKIFPNRIKYYGKVEGCIKKRILQDSHILIFPSFHKTEAFGTVIIEAMITGNAIIATNLPHMHEIIGEKEGIMIEPNNEESLKVGITTLLNDKNRLLEMQFHNIVFVKKKYAPSVIIPKIKSIILGQPIET